MQNSLFAIALLAASISLPAYAADTLKVEQSVTIEAPAAKVWSKINNFGDLGAWHPAVKSTQIVAGKNNQPGAIRLLTLQDGGTIKEELRGYSNRGMKYRYVILEGVLPVSHYASTITVKADSANSSTVTWNGKFQRKDPADAPAAGQDDATAVNTITSVYRGGLDNLKKILETK